MDEVYTDVASYFKPLTAESVLEINAAFCEEDGFMPNQNALSEIEPKLFSVYFHFLSRIFEKNHVNEESINLLIPELAAIILYYIASTQMFPTANKRTAAVSAELFLFENGFDLLYKTIEDGAPTNELTDLVIGIGANDITKEQTIEWFKEHCSKR